jgi:hypothetical protein
MSAEVLQAFYAKPEELHSARLRQLHALWLEACGAASYPDVAAIDPVALKPYLTDLVVVDVRDPDEPRFRLYGSGFREFYDRDFSNTSVRETPFPEREAIAETYRQVALAGQPRFGWYRWETEQGGSYFSEFVVLPYGSEGRVERLLVMEDLDPARKGIAELPDGAKE